MYSNNPITHALGLASQVNGNTTTTSSLNPGSPALTSLSSGGSRWGGAVCAPNGTIYLIPARSGTPTGKIDPNGNFTYTLTPSSPVTNGFYNGCLGHDGKIYAAPREATGVYIFDPVTETGTVNALGASMSDAAKWNGTIPTSNGKIYGLPFNSTDILVIDPVAGTATRSAMGATLTGTSKWFGGVIGTNGKIFCIPWDANDVLIIDPVTDTATRSTMGVVMSGTGKWAGGFLGSDGRIYCIPSSATQVLVIDPITETATLTDFGTTIPAGAAKWLGAVMGPDGKIYGIPYSTNTLFILDVANQKITLKSDVNITTQAGKYLNGCLNMKGEIYMVPSYAPDSYKLTFSGGVKLSKLVTLGPHINRN